MRARREGTSRRQNPDGVNSLSVRSTSTGSASGSLTDRSRSEPSSGSSRSGTARIASLPAFARGANADGEDGSGDGHLTCFQEEPVAKAGGQKERSQPELIELSSRDTWQHLSVTKGTDPADILQGIPGYDLDLTIGSSNSEGNDADRLQQSSPWSEPSYGSEKKRNITALNAVSVQPQQKYLLRYLLAPPRSSWSGVLAYLTDLSRLCVSGSEGDRSCKQGALQLPG